MTIQPVLLPEGTYTEAEQNFIDNSPPGLWPDNQNSNFGQLRKVITDIIQECIDEINHQADEAFVTTSVEYLSLWEEITNVPIAPAGKSDSQRRAIILPRLHYGPFTRQRVKNTIEGFITPTFGAAATFTPAGISFGAGGISLLSGAFSLTGTYRIYWNPQNFSYEIWLRSDVTPDIPSLTKEINRITPAGVTATIDNAHADVLEYFRLSRNEQPVLYVRDNGGTDQSGYADNGTVTAVTALAAPGLLHTNVAGGNAGMTFNGTTAQISVPHAAQLNVVDKFTVEGWIKPTSVVSKTILSKGTGGLQVRINAASKLEVKLVGGATIAISTTVLANATLYHWAVTKQGSAITIYINGVDVTDRVNSYAPTTVVADTASALLIGSAGGSEFYAGDMDEVQINNRILSASVILDRYNTGRDIATY